jgi:hypothetical protein
MEEYFVTYEQALALKELGFDEPCFRYVYIGDTGNNVDHIEEVKFKFSANYNADSLCISIPLKSQVFKWFREKYNLFHCIEPHFSGGFNIYIEGIKNEEPYRIVYKTYNFAESECIDKLISIIKEKKS